MKKSSSSVFRWLCILLLTTLSAYGSETIVVSVDEAVDRALSHNLGLQSQEFSTRIEERAYRNRFNVLIPAISSNLTLVRPNSEPETPPLTPELPRWNLSAGVDASLTLSLQILDGIEASRLSFENATLSFESAVKEVEISVRTAFYQLLVQQEQLSVTQDRFTASEARIADLQGQYESGLVDELSLLTQQVSVENQRPAIRRQQDAIQSGLRRFADLLGFDPGISIVLDGDIDATFLNVADANRLLDLVTQSTAVRQARQQVQQLEVAREATVSSLYPSLTFRAGVNPQLQGDPFDAEDVFDADNWSDSGAFSITLGWPIDPFLRWSTTRTRLDDQADQIQQARLSVETAERNASVEILAIIEQLETTLTSIESLQSNVELAERALDLAEEGYSAGLQTITTVEDTEFDLRNARLELLQEQSRYIENILSLENLLGMSLEELENAE
ncbi:MAG: TolC family protein [Spirochaetaceae bacterium]